MKILVTPRSFGKHNDAVKKLESEGYEVVANPYGRILTEVEMTELIEDIDALIVGVDPLNAAVLKHAKKLRIISKYGVGTDNIDLNYCEKQDIQVTVTQKANTESVADFAFALMLAVARRVVEVDEDCRNLDWSKKTSVSVYNKTLGIVGTGAIGKAVIRRAEGFNMNILAYDLYQDKELVGKKEVTYVELEQLIKESDFISLHLPVTEFTTDLFGKREFNLMKNTAILINTARGELVDEAALLNALKNKEIWGAGLDVFKKEPPENKELLSLNNLVIGAHSGASTIEAVNAMSNMSVENILSNI